MHPRLFSLIAGFVFLALALAEFLVRRDGSAFAVFAPGLFASHVGNGLLGLASLARRARWARWYAVEVGLVATVIALLGFIPTGSSTLAAAAFGVSIPMAELVIHLVLGVGGLFAGFGSGRD